MITISQYQALSLGLIAKKYGHKSTPFNINASTREYRGDTLSVVYVEVHDHASKANFDFTIFPGGGVYDDKTGEFQNDLTIMRAATGQPWPPV